MKKRNSTFWLTILRRFIPDFTIGDPDGWDRSRFPESWSEEITADEFLDRVKRSSIHLKYAQKPFPEATELEEASG